MTGSRPGTQQAPNKVAALPVGNNHGFRYRWLCNRQPPAFCGGYGNFQFGALLNNMDGVNQIIEKGNFLVPAFIMGSGAGCLSDRLSGSCC